jgi:hypothetical protein
MSLENKEGKHPNLNTEWKEQFSLLGDNLGIKVE